MASRWIVYQRERFPVVAHGLLIAAFSASAMSYSALLRGRTHLPPLPMLAVGFVSSFIFFLQLRIADEFKDFEDDARFRPYRPVPRGLVSLKELLAVGVAGAAVQLGLALVIDPRLALILGGVWAYFALMTKEFFAAKWLKAHPLAYLLSHMLIMPLIDFYVTAFDWLVAGGPPPRGLAWFLAVSFLNGTVVEIGRKIRAPEDEETGVETYSALWGRARATFVWLGALLITASTAIGAALQIRFAVADAVLLVILLGGAAAVAAHFLATERSRSGVLIEGMSGAWTLAMYLSLGVVPLALRSI